MNSLTKNVLVLLLISAVLIHESESRWGRHRQRSRKYQRRPSPCKPCNCKVSSWSQWNQCSATCGNGVKSRYRNVLVPAKCGGTCFYPFSQAMPCTLNHHCPVNGGWCTWSSWTSCNKPCGGGSRSRSRSCTKPPPAYGGAECYGSSHQTDSCNTHNCPVNGGWTSWSSWTSCNKPCGGGSRSRSRSCTKPSPAYGGAECYGSSHHTDSCNTHKCPVNGGWTSWSSWTSCNKPCGGGSRSRSRSCTKPSPAYGGAECYGSSHHTDSCNAHKCPVNGGWTSWSSWTSCNKPCGGGSRSRSRSCTKPPPAYGGAECYGSSHHTDSCNTHECPVNGGWTSWSSWTSCNKPCDGGTKTRSRSCAKPAPDHGGAKCYGSKTESTSCNNQKCGVDGGWCSWSSWTDCTKTCGGGNRSRKRTCTKPPPSSGGATCKGTNTETDPCNIQSCGGSYKDYKAVGCFKDNPSARALPVLLGNFRKDIQWNDMTKTIEKCANAARAHGYGYFALQFYGECYSGDGSDKTYNKYGQCDKCWNGVGKEETNFVYKFTYVAA